jgi:hypothetical protein
MAIHFKTKTPKKLLSAYKKAIDDGHVTTWTYDADGDFTHSVDQFRRKAWLRPKIVEGQELTLYILSPIDNRLTSQMYAIYHGRFIESVLSHCDSLFEVATASALAESGDSVGAQ